MVVEDDGILATALQVKLENWGYKSPVAFTSQDAVKQFHKTKPDLVIMDITLKGKLNGIETAELIDSELQTPIIYYSSSTDKELSARLKNIQNRDYVSKTSEDETLRSSIEKHIKLKSNRDFEKLMTQKTSRKDLTDFNKEEGDVNTNRNLNTLKNNVSYPDTESSKPKNVEAMNDKCAEANSVSSVGTFNNVSNFDESIEAKNYGSHQTIETELKKLETNFTKIFKDSKSQHQKIVELNNLVEEYKGLLAEKDIQINELKAEQTKLEERLIESKDQFRTVLNEMCSVNDQINKFIGTLND
ncbi:response regulator receiver [Methanobacterium lacus]|uniref:Response regulator receiver n=1 Tax=Methanobacterium lacus (strain AL-21) TaxID=877455 RepID=F0T7M6_METLA|nr:response regulator receiver [Methanobacterium lacus]